MKRQCGGMFRNGKAHLEAERAMTWNWNRHHPLFPRIKPAFRLFMSPSKRTARRVERPPWLLLGYWWDGKEHFENLLLSKACSYLLLVLDLKAGPVRIQIETFVCLQANLASRWNRWTCEILRIVLLSKRFLKWVNPRADIRPRACSQSYLTTVGMFNYSKCVVLLFIAWNHLTYILEL